MSPPPVTFVATQAATPAAPTASETPPLDERPHTLVATTPAPTVEWREIGPGIEFRHTSVNVGEWVDWLVLLRVDPAQADVQVHYSPGQPQQVREWQILTGAEVVINAGFFNHENQATGLVISDGQVFGQTYRGFGGMFSVRDGALFLRWLAEEPFRADGPDGQIMQAIQSFPMLARNGEVIDSIPDDGERNRRSFVGMDRAGRVVFGVTTAPVWSLTALAEYLIRQSDLALDSALNLDGGASSGVWVKGVQDALLVNSIDKVPAVIAVIPRPR